MMKLVLLAFALATCSYQSLTTAELANSKQGIKKENQFHRRQEKHVYVSENQYGQGTSQGIPTFQDYKQMKGVQYNKNNAFPSNNNKLPRYNKNKWKRSNDAWKSSKENTFGSGEKIQVAPEALKWPKTIKIHGDDDAVNKEGVFLKQSDKVISPDGNGGSINNVPHHDKSKQIWKFESKARSQWPKLKKWNGNDRTNNMPVIINNNNIIISPKTQEMVNNYDKQKMQRMSKEELQKKLEDEAVEKLRALDKKILELQAADLELKRQNKNTDEKVDTAGSTSNQSSNFFTSWVHAFQAFNNLV